MPAGVIDLAGDRLGRLTVIGFGHKREIAGHRRNGRGLYWLVRCDCGRFELRQHHRWMKAARQERKGTLHWTDMCQRCDRLEVVKRREAGGQTAAAAARHARCGQGEASAAGDLARGGCEGARKDTGAGGAVTMPTLTDTAIAAAAGAALRRIRLERVVQDLEQLGMPDLAFVVERRAAGDPVHSCADPVCDSSGFVHSARNRGR